MKAVEVKEEAALSDGQKIHILQNYKKLKKKWNNLDKAKKLQILEGMDIATDEKWLIGLFEEVK